MGFKQGFVWGAATASYQIDGAVAEDGRKPCVWDMFCGKPGAVFRGHTGKVACDHYHRYPEDVALMKQLGLSGYRFSVSWSRVIPDGVGAVNPKGLEFYDKLVDSLLEAGIQPWVTLFHWDLPLALYHKGGWMNPDIPKWFADYTKVVVDRISDRVTYWMTQNEPQCYIGLGLYRGEHAPGDRLRWAEVLQAAHNSNLAHGLSAQMIRASAVKKPVVGIAPVGGSAIPATESPEDIEAARKATFSINGPDPFHSGIWFDALIKGQYPEDFFQAFHSEVPKIGPDDMKTIAQPLDFLGLNIYQGPVVRAAGDGCELVAPKPGAAMTRFNWDVTPEVLYWAPKFYWERYQLPIAITENGLSCADWVGLDGKVHDEQRIDFTARYLLQLRRAAEEGVPVEGYFHWSLMDNFEWAEGFRQRFGLIHVDYETLQRTPKESYYWYANVIRSNGATL